MTAAVGEYVLIETVATQREKRFVYYARWTGIGPMTTRNQDEAARFPTEQAAMQSPAYSFALAVFKPERLADVREDVA